MVRLTQVTDESAKRFNKDQNQATQEDFSDAESELEVDDDDVENETLLERIAALKEIIPPQTRNRIFTYSDLARLTLCSGLNTSGKILWALTSSVLLLGIPLSIAILSETQLQELEKEMTVQQAAPEVISGEKQNDNTANST